VNNFVEKDYDVFKNIKMESIKVHTLPSGGLSETIRSEKDWIEFSKMIDIDPCYQVYVKFKGGNYSKISFRMMKNGIPITVNIECQATYLFETLYIDCFQIKQLSEAHQILKILCLFCCSTDAVNLVLKNLKFLSIAYVAISKNHQYDFSNQYFKLLYKEKICSKVGGCYYYYLFE
jgi:hypothetical protein